MRRIDYIVIHYSASDYEHQDAEWIRKIHKKKGWDDIGYHFFIQQSGVIEAGRPLAQIGAHVRYKNRHSIGICLAGLTRVPTGHQSRALILLLTLLKPRFPSAQIVGHRDIAKNATDCPGFDVSTVSQYWDTILLP